MANSKPKKKKYTTAQIVKLHSAKRSLGLPKYAELPRCNHKIKKKVAAFEAKGDFSHSSKRHICPECCCQRVAGFGTKHVGVGWCLRHEKAYSFRARRLREEAMADNIRKGFPVNAMEVRSPEEHMKELERQADESRSILSMREDFKTATEFVAELVEVVRTGQRPDGSRFTEKFKDGSGSASDITLIETMIKLMDLKTKQAKIELEIQEDQYVSIDETRIFYAEVFRLIRTVVSDEQFQEIIKLVSRVPNPRTGRKGNKK
jgi:hypothetical protein